MESYRSHVAPGGPFGDVCKRREGCNGRRDSGRQRVCAVFVLYGMLMGPAFASPGANRCDLATATTVIPGSPGSPASFTLSGNNSSPGVCSISAGACALNADCPVGQVCVGDCATGFDKGYWEAFALTADATVTIHFCNTTPVRQGGDWVYVATTCEAGTGNCGGTFTADRVARAEDCTFTVGELCPEVLCGAGNNNISMTFDALPGGTTYYLPILAANVCERTDPFNQNTIQCETNADCPVDRPCQSNRGAYDVRVVAEELPAVACCLPGNTCEERTILSCEAASGTYLGPPNRSPEVLCTGDPCATGSCCLGENGCQDESAPGVLMTPAACTALAGSYVGGIRCYGGVCLGGPNAGSSCASNGDCGGFTCDGTPEQLAQPSPCGFCIIDPSTCHEPVTGFFRFPSDFDFGTRTADDFVAGGSPITDVCWRGYYLDVTANCGPGPGDAFTISLYTDAGGYPGTSIASEAVTAQKIHVGQDGTRLLYEYTATLTTPVTVTPGTKYWLEIVNNTTLAPEACTWAWKHSGGGNNYSVINLGDVYGPEDVYDLFGNNDATFCLNTTIGPDDNGPVLGACCTCPSTCTDGTIRADCTGVWHAGQSCGVSTCDPPTMDNCASAPPLTSLSTSFRNTCADLDGPASVTTELGPTGVDHDVWYTFTATATNPGVTFSACDVGFDAVIAVYSNGTGTCTCPVDNVTLLDASDEECITQGGPFGAGGTVTIPVTAGNCYLVRVAGFPGSANMGLGRLEVSQLGAAPPTLYVNWAATGLNNGLNWTNAFTSLQSALAFATNGTEIWVGRGTYKPAGPGGSRLATFQLKNGVGLYGGFAGGESSRDLRDPTNNETILSGDLNGDDGPAPFQNNGENTYHVVSAASVDSTAVLDGFTITGGNADPPTWPEHAGGGVWVDGGSPRIVQCNIVGNSSAIGGGGMNSNNGAPLVDRCSFEQNRSATAGALNVHLGSATVKSCIFRLNNATSQSGAMEVSVGTLAVSDCSFVDNAATVSGGAFGVVAGAGASLANCLFAGNATSGEGGAILDSSANSLTLVNCGFFGNSSGLSNGGALIVEGDNPQITNCVFSGNSSPGSGGAMLLRNSSPTLTNCILWGNSDSGGMDESAQIHTESGTPVVNYSIVQGGWTGAGGTGNSATDPLFVNPGANDLRLQSSSPAIDAGDATALPLDTYDLDGDGNTTERISLDVGGNPRVLSDVVDMGAYEFFEDCNGGGIPDVCDLDCGAPDGPCDIPGCGTAADCDGNDIPDACDIENCVGLPSCDDCNLNGKPDACDVPSSTGCPGGSCVSGCSSDLNEDCIPDECAVSTGAGATPNWNDGGNWNLTGSFPDNTAGVADQHVTLEDSLILNITVTIDSLQIAGGVTLDVSGGDLLITGGAAQTAGITPPPKLRLNLDGAIALANNYDVTVAGDSVTVNDGGLYYSTDTTDSSLSAADVVIRAGGEIRLEHMMRLTSDGTVRLDGSRATTPTPCLFLAAAGNVAGITPPPKLRLGNDVSVYAAELSIVGAADLMVDSTQPVALGGDFDNRGVAPSLFDWTAGKLLINGSTPQTLEVAGINLGQTSEGFLTDQDALFDSCPHTNFSMGTLEVASTANVTFANRFANTAAVGCAEALYVHNLIFQSGATVTIDNCKVYYETLSPNGVAAMLLGCGELLSTNRPPTPDGDPSSVNKNRGLALSIPAATTAGPGTPTALRVALLELQNPVPPNIPQYPAPDFSAYEFAPTCTDPGGCVRWIGEPKMFLESQDTPGIGSFKAARLQCTPYYRDWSAAGIFNVVGAEITPSSQYDVQQFSQSCAGKESGCTAVSVPLRITTARSGDVETPFNPPSTSTQPDVTDVAQLVNKFKNVLGAPSKAIAQLQPNVPELNADINALDIVACVDAVKQKAYAFGGPCPCPSTVTCGSTACTTSTPCVSAYGPEALCVKTCNGGTNDGDPCINPMHCPGGGCGVPSCLGGTNNGNPCTLNSECPGGACNYGHCRDRCGRCTP